MASDNENVYEMRYSSIRFYINISISFKFKLSCKNRNSYSNSR